MDSNQNEESYENRSVGKSVKCFWRQRILVVAMLNEQKHSEMLLAPGKHKQHVKDMCVGIPNEILEFLLKYWNS